MNNKNEAVHLDTIKIDEYYVEYQLECISGKIMITGMVISEGVEVYKVHNVINMCGMTSMLTDILNGHSMVKQDAREIVELYLKSI